MIAPHSLISSAFVLLWVVTAVANAKSPGDNCLASIPSQVVAHQQLTGGHARVSAKLHLPAKGGLRIGDLRARFQRLAAPGHLMHNSVVGWQVFSFWQRQSLCVVQLRVFGGVVTAGYVNQLRLGSPGANPQVLAAPPWWPKLVGLRVEHWNDAGSQVRSILGHSIASESATRALFVKLATHAGYIVAGSMATKHRSAPRGSVLMFAQGNHELLVILIPRGNRTGVVAHLKENFQ